MPNNLFSEMALFLSSGRTANVIAKGDMRAMKLDGPLFLQMVTENSNAALGVVTALSEKVVNTSQQVIKNA
jgi:CRP-like cAMP-binding protein